jgi:putative tryptophan/tyrosine transport system substrate-binding protein
MRRREFIAGLGGATLVWPLAARGQQGDRIRRIGVLMNAAATEMQDQSYVATFIQELRRLGWIEGQNLRVDVRWNASDAGLARTNAAQLIGLMPDVILAVSTNSLTVIQQATSTVPVVFVGVSDPVAQGFVASIRQPGGNITGFSAYEFSMGGKWLNLLKETTPGLARVAVMFHPDTSQSKFFMQAIETAALSLSVQATAMPVRAAADIESALESFARKPNGGLILPNDAFTRLRFSLIADLADRYHLPSIAADYNFAKSGGLMDYGYGAGTDFFGQYRQAASYVDRILKGSKPGDLPVQAPIKYRLAINLKTAKALGLTVPQTLLVAADEVIE